MGSVARRFGAPDALAIVLLMVVSATPAAHAATYTVNTTGDPIGSGCAGGTCSLRQALNVVNAGSGGDRIVLPAGRIILNGSVLSVSKPVTIAGAGARASIVDANNGSTIMNLRAGASASASRRSPSAGGRASQTGGISNSATLRLTAVAVADNVAFGNVAGGILNNTGANLTVERSTISGNTAGTIGGAIYNSDSATITITNSTIAGNTANTSGSNWEGGGIYTDGSVTILNSTIVNNRAFRGAGIDVPSGTTAILKNTIVANNTATGVGQPGNCRVFGTLASQGTNLEDANACGFVAAGDLRNTPAGLGSLQDDGGSTDTLGYWPAARRSTAATRPVVPRRTSAARPATAGRLRHRRIRFRPGRHDRRPAGRGVDERVRGRIGAAQPAGVSYTFEYGTTTAYGSATGSQSAGAGDSPVTASGSLTGLKAATTVLYRSRLVGTNADGTSGGADRTSAPRRSQVPASRRGGSGPTAAAT